MDVTRSEVVPAELRLLEDGSPVTGATIVLDIRRAGDGFVVDWADSTLKALGSVGQRYKAVPQVSATDWPGLYRVMVDLGAVGGVADSGDTLVVTFYEQTAGPVYTPLDDARWRVVASALTATMVEALLDDALAPVKGADYDPDADNLHALHLAIPTPAAVSAQVATDLATAHGAGSWLTPSLAGLALTTDVTAAVAAIEAYGQLHWQTAVGFAVAGDAMTLTVGERTAIGAAVWATATDDGLYTHGEALSRLHRRQRHPYKLLANGTLQYLNAAGNAVEASRTILDVSGGAITAPGAGEPARASVEVDT